MPLFLQNLITIKNLKTHVLHGIKDEKTCKPCDGACFELPKSLMARFSSIYNKLIFRYKSPKTACNWSMISYNQIKSIGERFLSKGILNIFEKIVLTANYNCQVLGGYKTVLRSRDMGRAIAVRRWTNTALECYKRGCVCDGCFYTDFFNGSSQKCQMKASVLELVRVLGKPDIDLPQVLND